MFDKEGGFSVVRVAVPDGPQVLLVIPRAQRDRGNLL
jgi:hypothetical protein